MTKRKTTAFKGAWLDGRTPEAVLRGRMSAYQTASIDLAPVVAALSRQVELWRFWRDRQTAEPQPAHWAGLVRAIEVPDAPTFHEVDTIRAQVRALPARVVAVLNHALLERAGLGSGALFARMLQDATDRGACAAQDDVTLLRGVLADLLESLRHVTGKRGPRYDVVPALRAVHRAIVENSELGDVPARALAADLLNDCGISAPTGRSRLAQILAKPAPSDAGEIIGQPRR